MCANAVDEQLYKTLDLMEKRYNEIDSEPASSGDADLELKLLSKLALIEFCGWVEDSIDAILNAYLDGKRLQEKVKLQCKAEVKSVHGCSQDEVTQLFRRILGGQQFSLYVSKCTELMSVCGQVDSIGNAIPPGLKGNDGRKRNLAAHTALDPVTQVYFDAPSKVKKTFLSVHPMMLKVQCDIQNY